MLSWLDVIYIFVIVFALAFSIYKDIKEWTYTHIFICICMGLLIAIALVWIYRHELFPPKQDNGEAKEDTPDEYMEKVPVYEHLSPYPLSLMEGKLPEKGGNEKKLTWESFLQYAQDIVFIQRFHEAILASYKYKIRRYTEMLSRSSDAPVSFEMGNSAQGELRELLTLLNKRLRTQTLARTQEDLRQALAYGNTLVARNSVKDFLARQLVAFSRCPEVFLTNFQNMLILGESGIGKTKLAQVVGKIYARCGILARGGNIRETTKSDFVTAYVNESAKLTRKVLLNSLETVLFIDEAYDITPEKHPLYGKGLDHGSEAVTELVNFLDKYIGLTVVIAAGYKDEMEERFLNANQGMPRRFPHRLELDKYTGRELFQICSLALQRSKIKLNEFAAAYLWGGIESVYAHDARVFSRQGGDMLNLAALIAQNTYASDTSFENEYPRIILSSLEEFAEKKGVKCTLHEKHIYGGLG